jgi:periplasmic protein TonB
MDYAQQQRNPAKHLVGFTVVAILHLLLGYALVHGLATKIVEVVKKPFETKIVKEVQVKKEPDAPPPPPPKLAPPPPPFIPPPEINIAMPMAPSTAITAITNKAPPAPVPVQRAPVAQTQAGLDRGSCPAPEPNYPMASRRNQETGTVVLRLQVDVTGNVSGVVVQKSSGHTRLDEAAKSWISGCHFRPATVDGKAAASSAQQQYTFNLRD